MSLENEKRYLILLSSYCLGNGATKKLVLDYIENNSWINLESRDLEKCEKRNELKWRNNLAFIRKHLVMENFLETGKGWIISKKGEVELSILHTNLLKAETLSYVTKKALNDFNAINIGCREVYDDSVENFTEGKVKQIQHTIHERNSKIIDVAKREFLEKNNGKLFCEGCGFEFEKFYGKRGKFFIEAHHTKPISERTESILTKKEDIVMLCSNCHSMIHREKPWLSINELRDLIVKNKI